VQAYVITYLTVYNLKKLKEGLKKIIFCKKTYAKKYIELHIIL